MQDLNLRDEANGHITGSGHISVTSPSPDSIPGGRLMIEDGSAASVVESKPSRVNSGRMI